MKQAANPSRMRVFCVFGGLLAAAACLCVFVSSAAWADDSAEAFMSATFGLSSSRTQTRMENSGAAVINSLSGGRLTMKGTFEYRSAIFIFGFHSRRGLNHKSVYLASSGDAAEDRALYEVLREAYNAILGATDERMVQNRRARGRLMPQCSWRPDNDTVISLSYNPEITSRFPGDSPSDRPIHLIYNYTRWTPGA